MSEVFKPVPGGPRWSPDDRRHHVLYLVDRLHNANAGAEGAIQRFCRFLSRDRFRCSVATFWAGADVQKQFPCPVYVIPLKRIWGWNALKYGYALRSFLRDERIDIMHTFFPASDIWGCTAGAIGGCPILISSRRDMGILRRPKHRIPYWFINRFVDQVQAVSENVKQHCISVEKLPANKVVTVVNGIDLEEIDTASTADRLSAFGGDSSDPIVITVANPRYVKGLDVLIHASVRVQAALPQARFVIVGESQDRDYMQKLLGRISEVGVKDNFTFLGLRRDVFSLLKAADVFCLPSRSEGLSNALLEAMGCGLPCIATDVGGNPEVVVQGETGLLVPSENPDVLASQLLVMLRDYDLRKRMGTAGRRIVEQKFTVQRMVERLESLYNDLLQKRRSSPATGAQKLADIDNKTAPFLSH